MSGAAGWFLLEPPAGRTPLALPVPLVGRLEPVGEVLEVPGAPEGIVGVAEVRGRPTTLLDLSLWSGDVVSRDVPPRGALLLAPPREHLAIASFPGLRMRAVEPWRELPPGTTVIDAAGLDQTLAGLEPSGGGR